MQNLLNVRLLGGVRLDWCNVQLDTLHSPRLQALLAFLLLNRDTPQSRQQLAFLFFPDSTEAQARTNLRNLLHLLHHALPDAQCFLDGNAQSVQWRADAPFTLDVTRFENAVRAATGLRDWQAVVALYRGDLVPGCYDDWILPERERLRLLYLDALEHTSALCESESNFPDALRYAQQLLSCDPLREESYRRLMRLSALSADRAGVVRFYNQCVNVLARELAVEPAAETRAAFQNYSQLAAGTRIETSSARAPSRRCGTDANNLPLQFTSLVGRAEEIKTLCAAVMEKRPVTCTGAGGVGKTRLALAAAQELRAGFADGVWWVNLAPLTNQLLIMQAIANALNVREAPGIPLADSMTNFLRHKQLLLVLDNCEHLIEPARCIAEQLLGAAPGLHILATSRQSLGIAGEWVWRVAPLPVPHTCEPDNVAALVQFPAVELFVERACSVFAPFALTRENAEAVARICQRLDGIPLAIELAAVRVNLLDAREIAARLNDAFHLLTRGETHALRHHQTLRATMDWSYETLEERERILFRRLSVFAGGFSVEAAEAVCADTDNARDVQLAQPEILDLLSGLLDKSLVAATSNGHSPRMRLLEPVREYAREKLMASGEEKVLHERHLDYFLDFARQADERIPTGEQKEWLMRLELEHSNLRAALERSRTGTNQERGLELAAALVRFWARRGYFAEGQYWLDLQLANVHAPAQIRAKAFSGLGTFKYMQGHYADAATFHTQALALYQEADDTSGIIDSLRDLGVQLLKQTEYAQAQDLFEQSLALARKKGNTFGIQRALHGLGACALNQLEPARAQRLLEEALELAQLGQDKREILYICFQLGAATAANEGLASSGKWCQTALELARELGDKWGEASALIGMCGVRHDSGDLAEASAFGKQALRASAEIDSDSKIVDCFEVMANLATAQGNAQRAARLFGAGQTLRQAIGFPIEKMDIALYEKSMAAVRAQLDEKTFAEACAEGRAMTKEQAIAYALQDD